MGARAAITGRWRDWQRSRWYRQHGPSFERSGGRARRLLVDVSVLARHDAGTGIQRVTRAIWHQLWLMRGQRMEVVAVAASRRHGYCEVMVDANGDFRPGPFGRPIMAGAGDVFVGVDLSAHALPHHGQQVRAWRRAGADIVVFLYDLLPLHHPAYFTARARTTYRQWLEFVRDNADRVFAISAMVADDYRAWLTRHPGARRAAQIETIQLGADLEGSKPSVGLSAPCRAVLDRVGGQGFLIMVGTVEPRKGHALVLDAFERLWRSGAKVPPLLVVGRRGWKTSALQDRLRRLGQNPERLIWLESASDELLDALYGRASGLILASYAEGFGLPVAEAVYRGLPVLIRDLPPLRDIGGAVRRFDTHDADELARIIRDFIDHPPPPQDHRLMAWREAAAALADRLLGEEAGAAGGRSA